MSAYPVFIHHLFVAALDHHARVKSEDSRPGAATNGKDAPKTAIPGRHEAPPHNDFRSRNFNGPGPASA